MIAPGRSRSANLGMHLLRIAWRSKIRTIYAEIGGASARQGRVGSSEMITRIVVDDSVVVVVGDAIDDGGGTRHISIVVVHHGRSMPAVRAATIPVATATTTTPVHAPGIPAPVVRFDQGANGDPQAKSQHACGHDFTWRIVVRRWC